MSKKNRNKQAQVTESVETETKEFYTGTSVEMTETTPEELETSNLMLDPVQPDWEPVPSEIYPETPTEPEIVATPMNNFAVAAEKLEAAGIEPIAPITPVVLPTRGVLPDAFGNNVKGQRICSVCGIQESETLAKNPRYSFCKGKCVNCYGKTERKTAFKPENMSADQIKAKIAYYSDLLAKSNGIQGQPEVTAIENSSVITADDTIETSGANLDAKVDDLAEVEIS